MIRFSIDQDEAASDEEVAAIGAALAALLASETHATPPVAATRPGWHAASRLVTQGLVPFRVPVMPNWGHIERIRRLNR